MLSSAGDLVNLRTLLKNSAGGLRYRRQRCWGYVSVFQNTPENLILNSIFPLIVSATLLSGSRKGKVGV